MTVKIPGGAIDQAATDILAPLSGLLVGINSLGQTGGPTGGPLTSPPQSVAIIEAGATALTKWWTAGVAALGGATAITASVTGFWDAQKGGTRITLVAGTAAVMAAAAIAIAIIVASDVRGRAQGAAAIYAARAAVAVKFLDVTGHASAPPPPPPPPGGGGAAGAAAPMAALSSALTSIQQDIAGLDKRAALIALGSIAKSVPNHHPVAILGTKSGLTGDLTGVFLGPSPTSPEELQLNVRDAFNTVTTVAVADVTKF